MKSGESEFPDDYLVSPNMKNDGGPAFPNNPVAYHDPKGKVYLAETGMSLRDYFAAMALQGMLAVEPSDATATEFAHQAYEMADAMLKERVK